MAATNPFWEFSLALYEQAGVAPACLALQDEQAVDVNLLLFCCWRTWQGYALERQELALLDAVTADWRSQVLLPIRELRVQLRGLAGVEACRAYLQQAELEAERLQQQTLYAQVQAQTPGAGDTTATTGERLSHNLEELGLLYDCPPGALDEICDVVLRGLKNLASGLPVA